MKETTLNGLITRVVNECNISGGDSAEKTLRRNFTKFVEAGGGKINDLKEDGHFIKIEEADEPFFHMILTQLAKQEGLCYDLIKRKPKPHEPNPDDTRQFRQFMDNFCDGLRKSGMDDNQIQRSIDTLDRIFRFSFYNTIAYCHSLVDSVKYNMEPYPYTYQMKFIQDFCQELKREFARTMAECIEDSLNLCEFFQGLQGIGIITDADRYGDVPSDIFDEYRQRDIDAIAFIAANPEIRTFIEEKLNEPIEKIFGIEPEDTSLSTPYAELTQISKSDKRYRPRIKSTAKKDISIETQPALKTNSSHPSKVHRKVRQKKIKRLVKKHQDPLEINDAVNSPFFISVGEEDLKHGYPSKSMKLFRNIQKKKHHW